MNTKRIIYWLSFAVVIVLIVVGLVAAEKKQPSVPGPASPDEITATDHVLGPVGAPVALIEYSDFQCPACAYYSPMVDRLLEEASTTVRFAYRHFPLQQHENAIPTARAAEAAGKQGRFWEMYRLIFERQADWEGSREIGAVLEGYASELGLDGDRFKADMDSTEVRDKILSDLGGGQRIGINATPTFFVNGRAIDNPSTYEAFKAIIDAAAR